MNNIEMNNIEIRINVDANELRLNHLDNEIWELSRYICEMYTADNEIPVELDKELEEMYEEAKELRFEIKKIKEAEQLFEDAERLVLCRR